MSESIKVEYSGISIELEEDSNKWVFTTNGRERKADSLPKAKEAIDRSFDAVKKKKVKAFEPFDAWLLDYNDLVKVRVTSIAIPSRYSNRVEVWATRGGNRGKQYLQDLRADTEFNAKVANNIVRLKAKRDELAEQIESEKQSMQPLVLPELGGDE